MEQRLSFRDGVQFAWDSTSLSTFKTCPRKYQYAILHGFQPRAQSVHLTFGILYHKGLERFDYHKAHGFGHDDCTHMMVKEMMIESADFRSDDPAKNRFSLIRALIWYVEHFREDPLTTVILSNGRPAVELSFRFSLPITLDGEPYLYSGHLDRVATDPNGDAYVVDRKSTKSALGSFFFDKFNPNNQMSGYTAGGKIALHQPVKGVIIDGVQVGATFARFARGFTLRTEDQLDEWLDEAQYYIKQAEGFSRANYWPKNDTACDMYGGCHFRDICNKPKRLRDTWLQADYHVHLWDPLRTRGDI